MVKMKAVKKISWLRLGVLPVIFMLRTCWATTVIEMIFSTRNRYLCQKIIENMPKQLRIIISIYYTRTVSLLIKPVQMNLANLRSKQRHIQRTLQSIPLPRNSMKVATETEETATENIKHTTLNQGKDTKPSKRYHRGRYLHSEENQSLGKYKSLEMGNRSRKVSQHKFQRQSSQFEPYNRPARKKTSAHSIQSIQAIQDRFFLKSKRSKKADPVEMKLIVREMMARSQFSAALALLAQEEEPSRNDIELLQLKGVCLFRLQRYDRALEVLSRVLLYDKRNCRQVYIWSALCENQLNHSDKSMRYIQECIRLFPDHFEAYYFKAKVLMKLKHFSGALECFEKAYLLNSSKEEIRLHIAECKEMVGQQEQALKIYEEILRCVTFKELKFASKMCRLLIKFQKTESAEFWFQRCVQFFEKNNSLDVQDILLECAYLLSFNSFHRGQLEKALMKGEWVLTRGRSKWTEQTIKVMMAAKILERDFYGALNIAERLQLLGLKTNLGQLGLFCQGVICLMRKRALQASYKLEECQRQLKVPDESQLNIPITSVLHLYLFYTYSLLSRDEQALEELDLQERIGFPEIYQKSAHYNRTVTQGFISYNKSQFQSAANYFSKASEIDNSKVQPKLYLAVTLFTLAQNNQPQLAVLEHTLNFCCSSLEYSNGNFAAFAFYYRGLFRAWRGDWSNSVVDLDSAIDRSEDNFSKFFYLRALAWASLQNYKQGISDASIALSIDSQDPESYLLRARCLQIEGDPSQAFNDLQAFIALRPDDKDIHKFAGHLLFQNGAFEDALQAYGQGDVKPSDTEVFLTKSKTYFLLGRFNEASQDMLAASRSVEANQLMSFDYEMMKWLGEVFYPTEKGGTVQQNEFQDSILEQQLGKLKHIYASRKDGNRFGKIFKLPELSTFSGMLCFYLRRFQEAASAFLEGIELKRTVFIGQTEGDFQEDEGQKKIFINQMYYNVALCFCMIEDYGRAETYLSNCDIDQELHTYQTYQEMLQQVRGEAEVVEGEDYLELFSLKNKISRFLPKTEVPFRHGHRDKVVRRAIKICIPYPKVEPPDINPSFHPSLLATADLKLMERRPEAPWIFKQNNAIKFTDKMQVYSKLSLGQSSVSNAKKGDLGGQGSSQSFDFDMDIRKKLKLDAEVESKLNRMMNKK